VPAAPPAAATGEFASVEGLDPTEGLPRVAGNRKLYEKLLRQFAEQQGTAVGQTTAALAQGDLALAERLAHTLKGVAGNIGAKSVQASAGALEKLIRSRADGPAVELATQRLAAALDPLVAALRNSLAPIEPVPAPVTSPDASIDPVTARRFANQLGKLLSDFDPGAVEFVEAHRAALSSFFVGDSWSAFEKLVQSYAFTEAQAQLEQVIQRTL